MSSEKPFLLGVIEGFYGPPWSQSERLELFDWMTEAGLNTYLYAPKDDLKHRALWREPYTSDELAGFRELLQACTDRGVQFFYALSPGLDISYSSNSDITALEARFGQMLELGCANFCLLFDDIPDRVSRADLRLWGSLASAQAAVTNRMFRLVRQRHPAGRFLFCPTPYCGRMAERQHGGSDYLPIVGRELAPEIDIFWTGPEIISRQITAEHANEVTTVLRRKPLIWDNLHANDYDARRFFCGPLEGRARDLKRSLAGLLSNPNCELPLNFVPIRSLGDWVRGKGPWDPRKSYLRALEAWAAKFQTARGALRLKDVALFADSFYLPFADGPLAENFYRRAERLLSRPPNEWGAGARDFLRQCRRLREFCASLAELKDRRLFHSLCRRAWELREELALLEHGIKANADGRERFAPFGSDFHLPGTWRGGFVARVQKLLEQRADGSFIPGAVTRSPRKS